jgi:hypothetical protein
MMEEARALATERMIEAAKELGADEIIGVRYATSNVATGASEIFVYGTAVKVLEETTEDCEDVNATKTIGSNAVKANEAL